jgi:1-phosphatidylinositol-3-phosphate 5-kinase
MNSSFSSASLSSLKEQMDAAEASLNQQLDESSLDNLGNIRRAFIISAVDTFQRLQASTPSGNGSSMADILGTLPEWWKSGTHCLPDSNVVVRESEWGSIIAFTLRSWLSPLSFRPFII